MISNKKISELPPYIGSNSPNGEIPISIGGTTYKIQTEKILPNVILHPSTTFKFIQKGVGNTGLGYEVGDVFCGWKNDGTERWHEALYQGGVLTDSANFTPLLRTEI